MKNVILERLLTTPLEVLQRKEFIDDIKTNTTKMNIAIENMNDDLSEVAADAEQKVSRHVSSGFH